MAMETSERKMDLTNEFPDVENGGGEVLLVAASPGMDMWEDAWGLGMRWQHTLNGTLGVLAHVIFVFPYQNNGGYMSTGWLGWLHGTGDSDIHVW